MLTNEEKQPGVNRWRRLTSDGAILGLTFYAMLAVSGTMIALDLIALIQRDDGDWPGADRTEPVPMVRPSEKDHLRPYLPRTMPVAPGGGKLALPGYVVPPPANKLQKRMEFRMGKRGAASAVGRIVIGTAADFERFLTTQKGKVKSLSLHSPGGSVRDAIAMARSIRKQKIVTRVPDHGYCASSCPLAFAGGKKRYAGAHAWIGVHQVYTLKTAIGTIHEGMAEAQRISAYCQQFLVEMGVDARVWIAAMRTPKNQLYIFTQKELKAYKLIYRKKA